MLLDQFGKSCSVAVYCHPIKEKGVSFGFIGRSHCGLILDCDGKYTTLDGSGGPYNLWLTEEMSTLPKSPPNTIYKFEPIPDSVVSCMFIEMALWNGMLVNRDYLNRNSNWTLKCLAKKCGISINFGKNGMIKAPIGWDCQDVIWKYGLWGTWAIPEFRPCPCP